MTPAQQLEGISLVNDWVVGPLIPRPAGHTGGHFSCAYSVSHPDGVIAFPESHGLYVRLGLTRPCRGAERPHERVSF